MMKTDDEITRRNRPVDFVDPPDNFPSRCSVCRYLALVKIRLLVLKTAILNYRVNMNPS